MQRRTVLRMTLLMLFVTLFAESAAANAIETARA